ncbi:tetratricopeptide repeat protein [Streptomyces sp. NPDC056010]|uniref:tetratricopeptide repeat protein n=1 Tax=Streptomyces sp. NPDC056010 TaxID=3345679 RepID=UPI0035D61E22
MTMRRTWLWRAPYGCGRRVRPGRPGSRCWGLAGRYPEDQALRAFLAMALYNRGEGREAVGLLLKTLATASDDPGVRQYRRAIEHYADDLDAVEPG